MGERGTVTWLHLSDLHLCKPKNSDDRRRILEKFRDDLVLLRDQHRFVPDLIFVTGDLAYGHLPEYNWPLDSQYDEVEQWIEGVRELYSGLAKDRVFFVPGNHDVDRRRTTEEQTDWLETRKSWKDVDSLISRGDYRWQQYAARLHAYKRFLEKYEYKHLLVDSERLIYGHSIEIHGVSVGIAGFNTAWSCSRDREWGRVWLGRWQTERLHKFISGADLKIALMHHSSRSMNEYESAKLDVDLKRDFDFCLHGHEHEIFLDVMKRGSGDDGHHRLAAGAMFQGREDEQAYSLTRIDLTQPYGEIWMRRFDVRGKKWSHYEITGETDPLGVCRLGSSLERIGKTFRSPTYVMPTVQPPPPRLASAICFSRRSGALEFRLVRTDQERWIFPKKKPQARDEALPDIAVRAAAREGGATGKVRERLADFHYVKDDLRIAAFLLEIEEAGDSPNQDRKPAWFTAEEAAHALQEGRSFAEWAPLVAVLHEAWKKLSEDDEDAHRV